MEDRARFRLDNADRLKVAGSKAGRPTFKPVSGGRLKCNQLPHLGSISTRQAQALRNFCVPPAVKPAEPKPLVVPAKTFPQPRTLREVRLDWRGRARCPDCYETYWEAAPGAQDLSGVRLGVPDHTGRLVSALRPALMAPHPLRGGEVLFLYLPLKTSN